MLVENQACPACHHRPLYTRCCLAADSAHLDQLAHPAATDNQESRAAEERTAIPDPTATPVDRAATANQASPDNQADPETLELPETQERTAPAVARAPLALADQTDHPAPKDHLDHPAMQETEETPEAKDLAVHPASLATADHLAHQATPDPRDHLARTRSTARAHDGRAAKRWLHQLGVSSLLAFLFVTTRTDVNS